MTELAKDVTAIDVTDLLTRYSFDLGGYTVEQLVDAWLHHYPIKWVRLAVIEALYQGRYKAFSVEQILNLWKRRGKSLYRFNHEFERIICGRFPGHSTALPRFYHAPPRRSPSRSTNQSINQPANPIAPSSTALPVPTNRAELPVSRSGVEPPETAETTTHCFHPEQPPDTETLSPPIPEPSNDPINTKPASSTASSSAQGSPVSSFKPTDRLKPEPLVMVGTARSSVHREPIHQFVPASEFSEFYAKLKLVAQEATVDTDHSPLN